MSYRAFKRLLGESHLERKSRYLLGALVLVLMASSFGFYANRTEDLAYDQLTHTGRTLVAPTIARPHIRRDKELFDGMNEFQENQKKSWPDDLKDYKAKLILPDSTKAENRPEPEDLPILRKMQNEPGLTEDTRFLRHETAYLYYGAVRAEKSCVGCHRDAARMAAFGGDTPEAHLKAQEMANPLLEEGDLMAVVQIRLSSEMIESGLHQNRAILIAFALGTTLALLAGSYLIVRYVIVKPVKHLKSVADAIAAGRFAVRSDIQTGDEFEDLSVAFNRMLSNLIQMQERNRGLIAELDKKVDDLARANLQLFQTGRMKADFLSTMSHEFRTPLNIVNGFSEMLINSLSLSDKQQRWAANIHSSGKQLLVIINEILDLAKLEAGKTEVKAETLDVPAFCEQAATLFRPQAEKKEIELLVQVAPEFPEIRQDVGKLRQIVSNLLSNAVKFTPDGGRITLSATHTDQALILAVSDTGVGIPPEEQEMVFQKFRQASNPLTREQGGSGLGLSIVRELAKLLGGNVALQSEPGRGSTFTLTVAARLPPGVLAGLEAPRVG